MCRSSLHGVNCTASASQNRTRETLVVAQLALTLVFLVGAGLFLRTIHALRQVPLGFSQQNVLTGGVILNGSSNEEPSDPLQKNNIVRTSYLAAAGAAARYPRRAGGRAQFRVAAAPAR